MIYPSQGHQIALGWNQQANLKNFTAYYVDGVPLLPPKDRNGFTDGEDRPVMTGALLSVGAPIARLTFPWLSYAQIEDLYITFHNQNVTVAIHKPTSINRDDTYIYNAVSTIDLNQFQNLQTQQNGYAGVIMRLVLWEELS